MRSLIVLAVVAFASPAAAQPRDGGETGFIGEDHESLEVDNCPVIEGTDQEVRERASEHYKRGTVLYEQGDYRAAVEDFVAAYCHAPHYSVLKDIAQAYERQVEYGRSVAYLDRYILAAPDSEAKERRRQSFRVEVLRTLPAKIKVATVPANADVTILGPSGVTARSRANDEEPMLVQHGAYTMKVEMQGFEPISQDIEPEIGQPYSYYFRLEPKKGGLAITTVPHTARVFLDKKLVGIGKFAGEMPIGTYTVELEADGREPTVEQVEVTAGSTTAVTIELDKKPKSGRRELLIAGSLGGLIWGGGAFATIFGQQTTAASLGAALGLGIGFAGAYFGAPHDVTVGSSSFMTGSSLVFAGEGALIASFFLCDNVEEVSGDFSQSCDGDAITSAALAAGIAGLGFAAVTADMFDFDAGDAALMNSGALWGTVAGALFWAVFDTDPRLDEPLLLGGLNLGVAAGFTLAKRSEIGRGHVALIDLSGLAGMIAGVALVGVIEPDSQSERQPHFALGGMALGLITGAYLTRNIDEPKTTQTLQPSVVPTKDAAGSSTLTLGIGGTF